MTCHMISIFFIHFFLYSEQKTWFIENELYMEHFSCSKLFDVKHNIKYCVGVSKYKTKYKFENNRSNKNIVCLCVLLNE